MNYKKVIITGDGHKPEVIVQEDYADREDIGETFNEAGFASVYSSRSDLEAVQCTVASLVNKKLCRIAEIQKEIDELNSIDCTKFRKLKPRI